MILEVIQGAAAKTGKTLLFAKSTKDHKNIQFRKNCRKIDLAFDMSKGSLISKGTLDLNTGLKEGQAEPDPDPNLAGLLVMGRDGLRPATLF